jgi:hypothetical protein
VLYLQMVADVTATHVPGEVLRSSKGTLVAVLVSTKTSLERRAWYLTGDGSRPVALG